MPESSAEAVPAPRITLGQALPTWCRIAALSFGGPTAQIAVMHRILVDEKKWVGEMRFLHALNFCMLIPGPEAQQLATSPSPPGVCPPLCISCAQESLYDRDNLACSRL